MRFIICTVLLFFCSVVASDEPSPGAAGDDAEKPESVLSGRLSDEAGDPVTDARITLSGPDYQRTTTDEDGNYAFEKVKSAGNYRIRIESTGWVSQTDYSRLQRLSLAPASRVVQDFKLQKAARIKIRTVNEEGNPVRGVQINIASLADERYRNTDNVTTDFEGEVVVGGVPPSEVKYVLGFRHNHYAIEKLIVRLDEAGEREVETVTMRKGITVTGTALCSDGKPPAGWRVLAMPAWWHFGIYPNGTPITDDGVFELKHIVPGEYNVTISVPHGEGGSQPHTVLSSDLTALELPISVKMDYPSPSSLVYISGTAKLEGKSDSFRGVWFHANSTDRKYSSGFYLKKDKSEFKIGPIPKGDYKISVESPLIEPVELGIITAPRKDLNIPLKIRGKPTLNGRVTSPDGSELKNLKLSVVKTRTLGGPNYAEDGGWRAVDSTDGSFSLAVNSPGIYVVTAKADGFAPTSSSQINTTAKSNGLLIITLEKGVTLKGIVVDADNAPISGAKVQCRSLSGNSPSGRVRDFPSDEGAVYSGADGTFEISSLPKGRESIKVTKEGFCFARLENVDVASHIEAPLRVPLTVGGEIRGLVFDEDGSPAAGVVLHFQGDFHGSDYERGRFASAVTDSKGFYRVRHLPEQPIYITCGDEWNGAGVVRRAVVPGDGKRLTVHFGGPAEVTGRLLLNGKPAAQTRLTLGGRHAFSGIGKVLTTTDAEGRFTFHGAPPGLWTLHYGEGKRRVEWYRAAEIEVDAASTGDAGDVELVDGVVEVTTEFNDNEDQSKTRIQLVRPHQLWHAASSVGHQTSPREQTGVVQFDHVPAGEYEVVCHRASGLISHHRFEVTSDSPKTSINVPRVEGTCTVAGTVDPELLQNGSLDFWHENGQWHASTTTKPDGKVEVSGLPEGRWTIRSRGRRESVGLASFDLKNGQAKSIQVTRDNADSVPEKFGYLTIEVRTDGGLLAPAKTALHGPDGLIEPLNQYNTETGYYVPAGQYEYRVSLKGFKERFHEQVNVSPYRPDGSHGRERVVVKLHEQNP